MNRLCGIQWGVFTLELASTAMAMASSWNGLDTHFAVAMAREKNGFNGVKWGCSHWGVATAMANLHMSHFAYACKTKGKNGISHLISSLCVNCLISILEYSRIIDYSIIWMCIWCGLLQKLYKIKKSELLNSKVYSKV